MLLGYKLSLHVKPKQFLLLCSESCKQGEHQTLSMFKVIHSLFPVKCALNSEL